MLKLKSKLFDLIARNISIEDFEQWLYNDKDILDSIENNEFILDLIDRDYGSKQILTDIETLFFNKYNRNEFLIFLIETSCKKLLDETDFSILSEIVIYVESFHDWEDDFELLFNFYLLFCDLDLVNIGVESIYIYSKKINVFAINVLSKFKNKTIIEKENYLINGIRMTTPVTSENSKWFKFWKK